MNFLRLFIYFKMFKIVALIFNKVREMKNYSMVFKTNFDYYQRIAHKVVLEKKCPFRFSHIFYSGWWTFLGFMILQ
jgi:hypothetical protein